MKRPTEAWMTNGLFERGIGYVVIARFKGNGDAEAGVFMVDTWCLGIKNAFLSHLSGEEYESRLLARLYPQPGEGQALSPACARKLVESAIAYARRLGFQPHADCRQAQRVCGGINADECLQPFTFGKDGKPLYIQGPNDSPDFAALVMAQLRRSCGPEGYHYIMEVSEPLEEPSED